MRATLDVEPVSLCRHNVHSPLQNCCLVCDHDDSMTSFDTLSLLISPKFRICPAFGALSRGLAASAFR